MSILHQYVHVSRWRQEQCIRSHITACIIDQHTTFS